jgi:4-hydroxy-3-polyprenylbenzoate decarboxylase
MTEEKRWVLGVTGASGAVYGMRLLEVLLARGFGVDLILSEAGRLVLREEMGISLPEGADAARAALIDKFNLSGPTLCIYDNNYFEASAASGSYRCEGMVIAPCSMGTLAAVAHGLANNLIRRAADVMLKQRRTLILLARETPLSSIHLENMLTLSRVGAVILPPIPAFYQQPKTVADLVDFVTGRVLDVMEVDHSLYRRWGAAPDQER